MIKTIINMNDLIYGTGLKMLKLHTNDLNVTYRKFVF